MVIGYLILTVVVLLLVVAASNVFYWPRVKPQPVEGNFSISILIPARNEEHNLPDCLESVLRQGASVRQILVYDDHSTDQTAAIIRAYATRDSRVTLVEASPLPAGWCGKNFACAQLAAHSTSEWLLFLDADARLAPNAVARMVGEAGRRGVTFLSCWPGLKMVTFWERALMPMLNFIVFSLHPATLTIQPSSRYRLDPRLGLAHGACLLIHRRSYEEFGGHARVKGELFEDTRLAQRWRASGRAGLCLDGQDVVSLRMYKSFREIWAGFQKNFYPAFRRESSFWLFLTFHTCVLFLPFILALLYPTMLFKLSVLAILSTRALLAARFRHPWISVVLHPLNEAVLILLGLSSWAKYRGPQGVEWKGRRYQKAAGD